MKRLRSGGSSDDDNNDGATGGAALFCNSGSCYTTGTQMGDTYLYRVRCVQTECEASGGLEASSPPDASHSVCTQRTR